MPNVSKNADFSKKGIKNARLATLQQAEFPDLANNLALKIRCKRLKQKTL